jgi:hypothetical protein
VELCGVHLLRRGTAAGHPTKRIGKPCCEARNGFGSRFLRDMTWTRLRGGRPITASIFCLSRAL